MTLDKRILDIMKRYMGMLVSKKVLTTMEEVEANTNETNLVAAPVVAELNDKLAGFEPVLDSTGKITGYKTNVGGADTVFPFIGELTARVTWSSTGHISDKRYQIVSDSEGSVPNGYFDIKISEKGVSISGKLPTVLRWYNGGTAYAATTNFSISKV